MGEYGYSLHPYFKEMPGIGKPLGMELKQNVDQIKAVEEEVAREIDRVKNYGKATEEMNKKGELTAWQRLDYLIDPGPGVPCIPSMTRQKMKREIPPLLMAWARSPENGAWSSPPTTKLWLEPGFPVRLIISCG